MGKRAAEVEMFVGDMSSIPREDTAFYAKRRTASHDNGTGTNSSQSSMRAKTPVHLSGTSHHQRTVWANLCQISSQSAPGVDGQTVTDAKESLRNGLRLCCNRFIGRDTERRIFDACISRSP